MDTAVLSITRIRSGDAFNVIPQRGRPGRHRTDTRQSSTTPGVLRAVSPRGSAPRPWSISATCSPPCVNDEREAILFADAAASVVDEAHVRRDAAPPMASEDFGFMMREVPGASCPVRQWRQRRGA
jgi:hippurate hydrolase